MREAFGGFEPRTDTDAAVKLALNCILMDERLIDLTYLLTDGHNIGGIEGIPGWIIERRDTGVSGDVPYYDAWPGTANFYAHVEQSEYHLIHPDIFMEVDTFHSYVRKAIGAYVARNPSNIDAAQPVIDLLKSK